MRLFSTILAMLLLYGCAEQKRYIALSFDDGPNTTTTMQMLDVMERYGARGSFFVLGNNINSESAAAMRRAVKMGCQIENHSYSHPHMPQLSVEEQLQQVAKTSEAIEEYVERKPKFFRAPYIDENQELYETIDLTFIGGYCPWDSRDSVTTHQRIDSLMAKAADGQIFLLHDFRGNNQTVEALEVVIPALQEQGYEFVTVEELFRIKGITPQRGLRYDRVPQ